MAELVPLVRDIRGIYTDRARDRLPEGSVWEMTDWVPLILQAGARMRGAWKYQSPALANIPDGMIYAPFRNGSRLLVAHGTSLTDIPIAAYGVGNSGTIYQTRQNPVFHRNRVIVPAASGTNPARFVLFDGTNFNLTDAPVSAGQGRYATIFKDRTVLANSSAEPTRVWFSKVGDPTVAWDSVSLADTSYTVTGLAAQRTQVLAFHDSSVERLRGTTPPDSSLPPDEVTGDLILDVLWDRAGCYDARSIAYWQDNVLFCDARGIQLTDGAIVRNVAVQGGVINLWKKTFERGGNPPLTVAGQVHQDYYIVTVRHTGFPPATFVAEIPTRRVFQLGNVDSTAFAFSVGAAEKLFGANAATKQVTDMTPVFAPDNTILQVDGNSVPVLPKIASGWSLLTNKPGFKRVVDMHLSYQADRDDDVDVFQASYVNSPFAADQALGQFRTSSKYARKKMWVRRRLEGFAVRLEQLVPTRDSRIYDISLRAYPEEQTRVAS